VIPDYLKRSQPDVLNPPTPDFYNPVPLPELVAASNALQKKREAGNPLLVLVLGIGIWFGLSRFLKVRG